MARAAAKAPAAPFDLAGALLLAIDAGERINQYLLEHLDPAAWRAEPPGGKGRTIAAIVAHVHNVRLMWLEVVGKGVEVPPKLDREEVTIPQARKALAASHAALRTVVERAVRGDGRIPSFKPDVAGFVMYACTHDAHHRGQIALLARCSGHPLPKDVGYGMWEWGARAREA